MQLARVVDGLPALVSDDASSSLHLQALQEALPLCTCIILGIQVHWADDRDGRARYTCHPNMNRAQSTHAFHAISVILHRASTRNPWKLAILDPNGSKKIHSTSMVFLQTLINSAFRNRLNIASASALQFAPVNMSSFCPPSGICYLGLCVELLAMMHQLQGQVADGDALVEALVGAPLGPAQTGHLILNAITDRLAPVLGIARTSLPEQPSWSTLATHSEVWRGRKPASLPGTVRTLPMTVRRQIIPPDEKAPSEKRRRSGSERAHHAVE